MKLIRFRVLPAASAAAVLAFFLVGCASTKPEPAAFNDARVALEDARGAGAATESPQLLEAARAHLVTAESTFRASGDVELASHYARLAETEARDAQYRAVLHRAQTSIEAATKRKADLELAVRDAEIRALALKSQTAAEKARLEAEARAAMAQSEAEKARAESERARAEAEARVGAERARIEEQARAAEAGRQAAEADRARADQARVEAETALARQKAQSDLLAKLQEIERSARLEARGIVLTLSGGIYFETGRADVKPAAEERIGRIGEAFATAAAPRTLIVEGHTDSTGSVATNERLSERRAEAVRAILIAHGVAPDRVETHGYAATKPVASNATAEGRSQNRRVEIIAQGLVR